MSWSIFIGMKIIIFGATELGCLIATEFFEDHDVIIIDKEENITTETISKICKALNCDVKDIMQYKGAIPKEDNPEAEQ